MTSQLRYYFQASQAVRGADDVSTPHFYSQVNSLSVFGPKLILLFTTAGWSAQPYSINFGIHIERPCQLHHGIERLLHTG